MTHPELDELYELFALDLLETEAADEIRAHLESGCEHCQARLKVSLAALAGLASTAEQVAPRPELRAKVLQSIGADQKSNQVAVMPRRSASLSYLWLTAAAALLVTTLFFGYRSSSWRVRYLQADEDRQQLAATLKALSRSDTRTIQFGRAAEAHGRVFVNREQGLVFVASALPPIASGRTFQLWLIPASGAPRSAGLFQADANHESIRISHDAVETGSKAVAVSVEPEGGSSAPTTTPILIVPLGG